MILSNNFLLAGILATLLIIMYYYYVNHLMKNTTDEDDESKNVPMSVSLVDYGKKFVMFYILSFGIVFVGKKYLLSSESATELSSSSSEKSNQTSQEESGGFFSNLFKGGKQTVVDDNLGNLSEVKMAASNKIENFKTGQPEF